MSRDPWPIHLNKKKQTFVCFFFFFLIFFPFIFLFFGSIHFEIDLEGTYIYTLLRAIINSCVETYIISIFQAPALNKWQTANGVGFLSRNGMAGLDRDRAERARFARFGVQACSLPKSPLLGGHKSSKPNRYGPINSAQKRPLWTLDAYIYEYAYHLLCMIHSDTYHTLVRYTSRPKLETEGTDPGKSSFFM